MIRRPRDVPHTISEAGRGLAGQVRELGHYKRAARVLDQEAAARSGCAGLANPHRDTGAGRDLGSPEELLRCAQAVIGSHSAVRWQSAQIAIGSERASAARPHGRITAKYTRHDSAGSSYSRPSLVLSARTRRAKPGPVHSAVHRSCLLIEH